MGFGQAHGSSGVLGVRQFEIRGSAAVVFIRGQDSRGGVGVLCKFLNLHGEIVGNGNSRDTVSACAISQFPWTTRPMRVLYRRCAKSHVGIRSGQSIFETVGGPRGGD